MAVYSAKCSDKDQCCNPRLYQNPRHGIAADLPPEDNKVQKNEAHHGENSSFKELLAPFLKGSTDSDLILIAALIYLLLKEKADIKLVIALGYILM